MIIRFTLQKAVLFITLSAVFISAAFAQRASGNPKQEKLLNGLRVLMWSDQSAPNVTVKLRVHAGASFDPQEKEGVMMMLSEAIFPNEAAREFFKDDLGGSLEIVCNYDYIEITATSKPESYLTMLETLSTAVTRPDIDKETTETLKARHTAKLEANEKDAAYVADLAARKRLFGIFPYGRPMGGSTATMKNIDFADLIFAYQRLFGADNATLAISGNFPGDVGYRSIRRYFGSWLKSDKKVPSTFRQPDPPPPGTQIVESPETGVTEMRYALRGVARNDKDFAAASVLATILEQRLKAKAAEAQRANVFVRNHANVLPGVMMFGVSKIKGEMTASVTSEKPKTNAGDVVAAALNDGVTDAEFSAAKSSVTAEFNKRDATTRWLDADTFHLTSVKADQEAMAGVTLADVQRFADRLKQQPIASVLVLTSKSAE